MRLAPNQNTSKEKAICKKGAIRSYKITSKEIVDAKRLKMAYKTLRSGIVAQKTHSADVSIKTSKENVGRNHILLRDLLLSKEKANRRLTR